MKRNKKVGSLAKAYALLLQWANEDEKAKAKGQKKSLVAKGKANE